MTYIKKKNENKNINLQHYVILSEAPLRTSRLQTASVLSKGKPRNPGGTEAYSKREEKACRSDLRRGFNSVYTSSSPRVYEEIPRSLSQALL